jgi:anthranilate synthase component I
MVLTQSDINLIAPTTHVTVSREVATDLDTPVSLYLKLAATTNGPSFLLESVTGGEQVARYSFIGIQPKAAFVIRGRAVERHSGGQMVQTEVPAGSDPLTVLREELNQYAVAPTPGLPRFVGGMVGYLGYENVQFFEPTLALPQSNLPDGIFLLRRTSGSRRSTGEISSPHFSGRPATQYQWAYTRSECPCTNQYYSREI